MIRDADNDAKLRNVNHSSSSVNAVLLIAAIILAFGVDANRSLASRKVPTEEGLIPTFTEKGMSNHWFLLLSIQTILVVGSDSVPISGPPLQTTNGLFVLYRKRSVFYFSLPLQFPFEKSNMCMSGGL